MIKTLTALAEPNRLNIVELLHDGPRSVGEIVEGLHLPQPQISKHLRVLCEAGLVEVQRDAQRRIYRLRAQPFQELNGWLASFHQVWDERFNRLDEYLQELQATTRPEGGTLLTNRELVITRTFDAPRELVFKAWTQPEQVARWWGPKDFTNPVCELDLRPGGAINIHMRGPDGTLYPMKGIFEEIIEPERLVMSSSAVEDAEGQPQLETLSTITFTEDNGKTKLTLQVVVVKATSIAAQALAGMEEGWNQSLDRLAEILR